MHYVRSLEQRVKQLEEEKLALQQKLGQVPGTNNTNGNWENDVRDQMLCVAALSDIFGVVRCFRISLTFTGTLVCVLAPYFSEELLVSLLCLYYHVSYRTAVVHALKLLCKHSRCSKFANN
jgi:hypothetical protein